MSGEVETNFVNPRNLELELAPGASCQKSPRIRPKNMDDVKTSLWTEIMADLAKITKRGVKEYSSCHHEKTKDEIVSESESDEENIYPVLPTSTPLKSGKAKTKKYNRHEGMS